MSQFLDIYAVILRFSKEIEQIVNKDMNDENLLLLTCTVWRLESP